MNEFVVSLRNRLALPLPGLATQLKMAPPYRGEIMPAAIPGNARQCAVLIPLYMHKGQWHTAFMRRAEDGYTHSGQVSFAGGGREPDDRDFTHTALREAEEEIGIPQQHPEPVGFLSHLYVPPSNSLIYPLIAALPERPTFKPAPKEVAYIIETPLSTLFHPDTQSTAPMFLRNTHVDMPVFRVHDNIIWGATAMIVRELMEIMQENQLFSQHLMQRK